MRPAHLLARRWLPLPIPLLMVMAAMCWPTVAAAAPDGAAQPLADAKAWLARIHAAASTGNYQGTMVSSAGGTMSSSRVWHFAIGDQTFEQLEALDGRQQRILRHNDTVHTLWPQTKVAVLEKRETLAGWSTTPQEVDPQALEQYELRREGDARIAGRPANVFLLEPRDQLRYAQRLWADQATGLMLRADVMAPAAAGAGAALRTVLESTAFSEIAIGIKPQPEIVTQAMLDERKKSDYRVVRPQQQRTTLDAEGWALANPVAGFKLAGCVRRGMDTAGDASPVLQVVFTDGLTHVSLFVEQYLPQRHRADMHSQQGASATLTLRRGEHWVTAVGDLPPTTLRLFAAALERKRP
jgi:sigma-E factor negative regulatory protein RseB